MDTVLLDDHWAAKIEDATRDVEDARQAVERATEELRALREYRDERLQALKSLKAQADNFPRTRRFLDTYVFRRDSGCTLQQLGDQLDVNRERARQIYSKGERLARYYVRHQPNGLAKLGYSVSDFPEFAE